MRIFADNGACSFDNQFRNVLERWQQPGDITDVPRASFDCVSGAEQISSRYLEDGSYWRLQDLTLATGCRSGWPGISGSLRPGSTARSATCSPSPTTPGTHRT